MAEKCTWAGCGDAGTIPQRARDGERWALLCPVHAKLLADACTLESPAWTVKAWILAQGGPGCAAARMGTARTAVHALAPLMHHALTNRTPPPQPAEAAQAGTTNQPWGAPRRTTVRPAGT